MATCQKEGSAVPTTQVPEYRGYANLGTGQYLLNHSNPDCGEAELVISIATEEEKAGRIVGDLQDNAPGNVIQPEAMCIRIRFANVAGLDALEQQLAMLRAEHFPAASAAPSSTQSTAPQGWDAEYLAKRVSRIAKLVGYPLPSGTYEDIAGMAPAILGSIAGMMERAAPSSSADQTEREATERADFIMYAAANGFDTMHTFKCFLDNDTEMAWIGWKARAALSRESSAAIPLTYTVDGEVMSPLEYINYLHEQLSAAAQPNALIPEGHAIVPIVPTGAMMDAGTRAAWKAEDGGMSFYPMACYRAMVAAAPMLNTQEPK